MPGITENKPVQIAPSTKRISLLFLLLIIPISLLFDILFTLRWGYFPLIESFKLIKQNYMITLGVVLAGITVHELLHGITMAVFARNGFRSITFGFNTKALAPYCHCKDPVKRNQYLLGAIMPAIFLGLIPLLLAMITGNSTLFWFGYLFTIAAIGDIYIAIKVLQFPKNTTIQDHPKSIGFTAYT